MVVYHSTAIEESFRNDFVFVYLIYTVCGWFVLYSSSVLENRSMHRCTLHTHHIPHKKTVRNSNEVISLFFCIDCTRYDFEWELWMNCKCCWIQYNAFSCNERQPLSWYWQMNEWMNKWIYGWIEINALKKVYRVIFK